MIGGGFTFSGTATGNATADFLLGVFNSASVGFGVRDTDNNTNFHSFFFQDEFKVRSNFTLTYGLRYEPFLPWKEANNRVNTVRPYQQSTVVTDAPIGIVYVGDKGITPGIVPADKNNFAPRVRRRQDLRARRVWHFLRKCQRRLAFADECSVCRNLAPVQRTAQRSFRLAGPHRSPGNHHGQFRVHQDFGLSGL